MNKAYKAYYQSEIGWLELVGTEASITAVNFLDTPPPAERLEAGGESPAIAACLTQLDEYFKGERQEFSLALEPDGTDFQKAVWQQLLTIPYAQTTSYIEVARRLGNEKSVRAVGAANGQNRISIIIPCHRVIGSNGQLVGYGGGMWRKAWLLEHERRFGGPQMSLF